LRLRRRTNLENADNKRIGDSRANVHFISFLFVIVQQFPAENTLLNNRIKISTFVRLLADVPAESYKLPSHRQCVDVGSNAKSDQS